MSKGEKVFLFIINMSADYWDVNFDYFLLLIEMLHKIELFGDYS